MLTATTNELTVRSFQIIAGILAAIFLYYGMDVRRKHGARNFVAPVWQRLMKFCAFLIVGAVVSSALTVRQLNAGDCLALAVMASGTAFVAAAKHTLGKAHTFTGQYLAKPLLITHGIYSLTRNPLYFGVLQCELGGSVFVMQQAQILLPQTCVYWLGVLAVALLYTVFFNWIMAVRESRYLESVFPEEYRRYSADVPFFIPSLRLRKEVKQ
jgi:protein-S-isoprenylcysteine O-methyltransferase Ste14